MAEHTPKRVDSRRTRERILDAAAEAYGTAPDVTLPDIAAEAGVSRATMYRHFPDPQSLRDALVADAEEIGRALIQEHLSLEAMGGDPDQTTSDQIARIFRVALPVESRFTEALKTQPTPHAGLIDTFLPLTRAMLRRARERGEFRTDVNLDLMAETCMDLALLAVTRVHRDGVPVDDAMEIMLTFIRGLETRPSAAPRSSD